MSSLPGTPHECCEALCSSDPCASISQKERERLTPTREVRPKYGHSVAFLLGNLVGA